MSLIHLEHISKVFITEELSTTALADVSLSIDEGEFVAIIGPSGSGKSTLLHILGLLDRQTEGAYMFEGRDTAAYNEDELAALRNRTVGFVFQSFNLLARTSVLENVMLPLAYSEVSPFVQAPLAKETLELVNLSHRLTHEPAQLSGGEKQRVAIARALVNDPKVIFADEPTGNLDSASGESVMRLLESLHKEKGHTIVLITHDLDLARRAERIVAIRDGRIEWDGKAKEYKTATT